MNITEMLTQVTPIVVCCYLIGMLLKITPLNNKFIPAIVGLVGGILGAITYFVAPEIIATTDIISAVAIGIVSGLASTGVNQIGKQLTKKEE